MLNNEPNPEECDATEDDSSTGDDQQIINIERKIINENNKTL